MLNKCISRFRALAGTTNLINFLGSCASTIWCAMQPKEEHGKPRERFVLSVAYSPDGTRLACGAMDGTVRRVCCEPEKRVQPGRC